MTRCTARWPAVVAVALLVPACGVPTGGAPRTLAPSDVPYGLDATAPSSAPAPSPAARSDDARVYLVSAEDLLVPRARAVVGGTTEERLGRLLDALAAGPSADELDQQLTTALPPDVDLRLTDVTGDTATIDLATEGDNPSGQDSRRAVGQIVLSATSLPDVGRVALTLDGQPLESPLPSGELTAEPLTAEDYAALRTSPPP